MTEQPASKTPRRKPATRRRPAKRSSAAPAGDVTSGLYRLVARSQLPRSGVTSVETPHGRLAVGIAGGEPFAVSGSCRHLFADLGNGRVTSDGCLECPWHHSRYDVTTGRMVRGPQGLLFLAVREGFKLYASYVNPLQTYPVVEYRGVLYLDED